MSYVEEAQIDLINKSRLPSVAVTSLSALFLYFILNPQMTTEVFSFWLLSILCIDLFRVFTTLIYFSAKKSNRINHIAVKRNLLLSTIFLGAGWGVLGIILIPEVDLVGVMLVLLLLLVLVTGTTFMLAYQYHLSLIFVLLTLIPLVLSLPLQSYIGSYSLVFLVSIILILMVILLRSAKKYYNYSRHMLQLQTHSHDLLLQREKAELASHAQKDFISKMSHDLRTPMHAILGFSSLGLEKVESASHDKISSYFSRINNSGQILSALLNDLLEQSKFEAGRLDFDCKQHDLQEIVANVVEELRPLLRNNDLTVDLEAASSINTQLTFDAEKISHVIRNLISNAMKFSAKGQNIGIYFDYSDLSGEAANEVNAAMVSVAIQIKGAGIPESAFEIIFDEFVQVANTGNAAVETGLGLSISRKIILHHKGIISINNAAPQEGAIFTISLPYQISTNTA